MEIKTIIDRIEDGQAILLSDEMGIEISIPLSLINDECCIGETLCVTLDGSNVRRLGQASENE